MHFVRPLEVWHCGWKVTFVFCLLENFVMCCILRLFTFHRCGRHHRILCRSRVLLHRDFGRVPFPQRYFLYLLGLSLFCGLHWSDLDVFSRLWRVWRLALSNALFPWNVDFRGCLLNNPRSGKTQKLNVCRCCLVLHRRFRWMTLFPWRHFCWDIVFLPCFRGFLPSCRCFRSVTLLLLAKTLELFEGWLMFYFKSLFELWFAKVGYFLNCKQGSCSYAELLFCPSSARWPFVFGASSWLYLAIRLNSWFLLVRVVLGDRTVGLVAFSKLLESLKDFFGFMDCLGRIWFSVCLREQSCSEQYHALIRMAWYYHCKNAW